MEPTREQLDKAWHLEGATPAIIAEALADEFARGKAAGLEMLAVDDAAIEVARSAIENTLIDFRNRRISLMGCGNGLVVREKDGTESSLMRLTVASALKIGLKAMAERALKGKP